MRAEAWVSRVRVIDTYVNVCAPKDFMGNVVTIERERSYADLKETALYDFEGMNSAGETYCKVAL